MVKLKGFTLFESVVSITIISICFSLSMIIYSKVIMSSTSFNEIEAKAEIKKVFFDLKESKLYTSQNYTIKNFEIFQKISPFKGNKNLIQVDFIVSIEGKECYLESHIVYDAKE